MDLTCSCGMKFRSYQAEAKHRHNFPLMCKQPKAKPMTEIMYAGIQSIFPKAGKFRKKPTVIEAFQLPLLHGEVTSEQATAISTFISKQSRSYIDQDGSMIIHTLEGDMRANPGDWIITGVKGEHYPCKPDIFEMTYEAVGAQ